MAILVRCVTVSISTNLLFLIYRASDKRAETRVHDNYVPVRSLTDGVRVPVMYRDFSITRNSALYEVGRPLMTLQWRRRTDDGGRHQETNAVTHKLKIYLDEMWCEKNRFKCSTTLATETLLQRDRILFRFIYIAHDFTDRFVAVSWDLEL